MKKTKICVAVVVIAIIAGFAIVVTNNISGRKQQEQLQEEQEQPASDTDGLPAAVEETGSFSDDIEVDILTRHLLPSFERMEENDRNEYVESLQVIQKINNLGLDTEDFLYPEKNLEETEQIILSGKWEHSQNDIIDFHGETSGELQDVINANSSCTINILSESITMDDAVVLADNICIEGNGVKIIGNDIRCAFVADSIKNIHISSVQMDGNMDYGFLFVDCENIEVEGCSISNINKKPICILGNSKKINIKDNIIKNNMAGGIYLWGDCSYALIDNNTICDNSGTRNTMAGVALTNYIDDEYQDFLLTYTDEISIKQEWPHEVILRNNTISGNNSSGIYFKGAYSCYVVNNTVQGNDKEGMCLDFETIGCYLTENLFDANGRRMRQTDEDLMKDFVYGMGRMDDGSAISKLPGVSLDNAAYNILINNIVSNNYGGGIKMVRTTVRTLIMENIVKDNNMGVNDVHHFSGIELGAAAAGDELVEDMDFTSDFENIICRNVISGKHYSGILMAGESCYINDIFHNIIMDTDMYAIEALSTKFNYIVDNLSDNPVRNEYIAD
jgi:parallel beta-helix repeat protein